MMAPEGLNLSGLTKESNQCLNSLSCCKAPKALLIYLFIVLLAWLVILVTNTFCYKPIQ